MKARLRLALSALLLAAPGLLTAPHLTAASPAFTWELYQQTAAAADAENLALSPLSVHTALAMVYLGARGETRAEMAATLGFDEEADIAATYAGWLDTLNGLAEGTSTELSVVQGLWLQDDFTFHQPYVDTVQEAFRARTERRDLRGAPDAAREAINAWVAAQTWDRIRDLFPPGSINQDTILALVNALYLQARWSAPFPPETTSPRPFTLTDGTTREVSMMFLDGPHGLYEDESGAKVLRKDLVGEGLSYFAVLPPPDTSLDAWLEGRDVASLTAWFDQTREQRVMVQLPRHRIETKAMLKPVLSALGMPTAFAPGQADFSGISNAGELFLQSVVHQTFLEVTEAGIEGAAATGISVGVTSLPPTFHANRPFFFVVREAATGQWLFCGHVKAPDPASAAGLGQVFPAAPDLGKRWRDTSLFGPMNDTSWPWVYHKHLGWLYFASTNPARLWLYQPTYGWLWTGTGSFPAVWMADPARWVWYNSDPTAPAFVDFANGQLYPLP